jgi:hypothetical protein
MNAVDFNAQYLEPSLLWLHKTVPGLPLGAEVQVLLLAIAGQESAWQNIGQSGGGPGRGPFQFEPETCLEILNNVATSRPAEIVCAALSVAPTEGAVYSQIIAQPSLATAFARLDLYANPRPLPQLGDRQGAWLYYMDTWRPGKPRPDDWPVNYQAALAAITKEPKPMTSTSIPPLTPPTTPAPSAPPLISSSPATQGTAASSGGAASLIVVVVMAAISSLHLSITPEVASALTALIGMGIHALVLKFSPPSS